MDFNLIKRKLLKYWIRVYYYNNELILWLKRNCRKSSNLLLLLLSPYIFMKAGLYAIYERVWGKYVVARKITKERASTYRHEIAMVSISKNEAPYIKEWIEFHKLVGFTKFYFYDNESAFLDMDEYLMPAKPFEKVYNVVSELICKAGKGTAGIGVNWCIYGSAHLEKKPKGLIMENFIYRSKSGTETHWGNFHIKTICNPRLVKKYISPHYPIYKLGGYSINDSDGKRLWGWFCHDVKWQNLRINHYYCKSKEQYIQKISRGFGDRVGEYDMKQFNDYDLNDVRDESMLVYADKVRL